MSYELTAEQQAIVNFISNPTDSLLKVQAVAGASKTTTLTESAKQLQLTYPGKEFKYLVFGRAASEEARSAFGTNAVVSTIHQLAYAHTIRTSNMNVSKKGYLSYHDVPKSIKRPYGIDYDVFQLINQFTSSRFLELGQFINDFPRAERPSTDMVHYARLYMNHMLKGTMPCTHDFYLKVFHRKLMNGNLQLDEVDVLAVDEAQDLTPITLDIFDNYPAKLKVVVGDEFQSIFGWMGCINAFEYYAGQGTTLQLTKSFRVNSADAKLIQDFTNSTFAPDMVFEGFDSPEPANPSYAYLTRTNSELIAKMMELNKCGTPYKLSSTTKVDQMFKLPLGILYLKPGYNQKSPELMDLQKDVDNWHASPKLKRLYKNKYTMLLGLHKGNSTIEQAVKLVLQCKDTDALIAAREAAEAHKKSSANLSLMTVHTAKGKLN